MAKGKGGLAKWIAKEGNNLSRKAQHAAADVITGGAKVTAAAEAGASKAGEIATKHPGKTAAAAGVAGAMAGRASKGDDDKKKKKRPYCE